jgi:hypothetical protein
MTRPDSSPWPSRHRHGLAWATACPSCATSEPIGDVQLQLAKCLQAAEDAEAAMVAATVMLLCGIGGLTSENTAQAGAPQIGKGHSDGKRPPFAR